MASESSTLKAIEQAISEHHHECMNVGEPPFVTGWLVAWVAVDGDGSESLNYSAGQGTTNVTAIGLAEWAKNEMLNPEDEE